VQRGERLPGPQRHRPSWRVTRLLALVRLPVWRRDLLRRLDWFGGGEVVEEEGFEGEVRTVNYLDSCRSMVVIWMLEGK
jgi:hypothetical protein